MQLMVLGLEFGEHIAEFTAIGTAVLADPDQADEHAVHGGWRDAQGSPFTCDLNGQDFWTLVRPPIPY